MTTHDDENRHGGLRGAVDELFGRGESDGRDERDENVRRDDAYADDATLDREPGTATEYGDTQSQSQYAGDPAVDGAQPYGNEVRGETVTPEQVQHGGDPTAQGQVQHGGEVRGDTDLPGESRFDDPQDGARGEVPGDARLDDAAVTAPSSTASGRETSGYADDATDPGSSRADVAQPAGEPVGTDTYAQAPESEELDLPDEPLLEPAGA